MNSSPRNEGHLENDISMLYIVVIVIYLSILSMQLPGSENSEFSKVRAGTDCQINGFMVDISVNKQI